MALSNVISARSPYSSAPLWFPKSSKDEHMPRVITTNFLIKAIQKDYTFGGNFLWMNANFTRLTPHKSWWGRVGYKKWYTAWNGDSIRQTVPGLFPFNRLFLLPVTTKNDQGICNWQIFANLTIKLIDPRRFLFPAINLYHGAIYSEVLFSFFGFMTSLRFCKPPLRSNTGHYGTLYLVNPSPFEIRRIWQRNSHSWVPTPLGIGRDTKYLLNLDFDE